jgi:hypothetical protein
MFHISKQQSQELEANLKRLRSLDTKVTVIPHSSPYPWLVGMARSSAPQAEPAKPGAGWNSHYYSAK